MIMPDLIPDKAMFKPIEIARLFGVTRSLIYEWVKLGNINAVKIGETLIRIPREDVLSFIKNGRKGFMNTGKGAVTNRVVAAMRGRIGQMIRYGGIVKEATSMKLLGCTLDAFRAHIEKQFQPGMTWDNYGKEGWEIDHIIPCSSFDLSIPGSQRVCFNYSNLQPLWHIDNMKKGNKYTRRNIRKVIRISKALS